MTAAIIILLIIILLFVLIWMLPSFVLGVKRQTYDEAFSWQSDHYDTSFYGRAEKTDYTVSSYDGYVLHAQLLRDPGQGAGSGKYVIITHGYTDNLMGALKYAWFYLDLGYSCIIYDLRAHGRNEKSYTTYGIRESRDLLCMIEDTRERYPDLKVLGLHGESLGTATTIMCLRYKPDVDFAVADCGFADIENVLEGRFRTGFGGKLLVKLADLGARMRYHCSFKDMQPIEALKDNEVPVLFIHGTADTLISVKNSEKMAASSKGRSELHLFPGAKHAMSAIADPVTYAQILKRFIP